MERYDIFRKCDDGSLLWVEAIEDLKAAQTRIEKLSRKSAGEYCIFDQNNQVVLAAKAKAAGTSR